MTCGLPGPSPQLVVGMSSDGHINHRPHQPELLELHGKFSVAYLWEPPPIYSAKLLYKMFLLETISLFK